MTHTHDPLCEWGPCICPRGYDDERGHLVHCPEQYCECEFIAKVRADERRWVTACAGDELLNHKIEDGICACGMDAPDALEHLAWIVSDYVPHSLKPEHEVKSAK